MTNLTNRTEPYRTVGPGRLNCTDLPYRPLVYRSRHRIPPYCIPPCVTVWCTKSLRPDHAQTLYNPWYTVVHWSIIYQTVQSRVQGRPTAA